MRKRIPILIAPAVLMLAGCGVMEPTLPEAEPGIPVNWPLPPTSPGSAQAVAQDIGNDDAMVVAAFVQGQTYRAELGVAASRLEESQARIELETARADLWQFTGQVAQDINALRLLTGTPLQQELLVRLDSQRTLYSAQPALVSTLLAQQSNRVNLYKVLGGGWQ